MSFEKSKVIIKLVTPSLIYLVFCMMNKYYMLCGYWYLVVIMIITMKVDEGDIPSQC